MKNQERTSVPLVQMEQEAVESSITVSHIQKIKNPKNPLAISQENAVNWWREKTQSDNGKIRKKTQHPKR
ncbi:hypothetical protein L2E82_01676 [Cichorium intybus]|uniref:Uncharacterized protein n=1 Tax=Cichorium intybus TaxID=13427 RepID=A0ACB9GZK4_CICIN|nr:hypothetical protein L2E82_01676 [Cichorium intybus]